MKNSTALILASLWLGLPAMAVDLDLSKLPAASTKAGVTYAKDIHAIFQSSCFRCHGEERQKGGLRLDSLEAALKGGEDGKVIVPGKSKESPLVIAVARLDEKKAMPPKPKGGPGRGGPGGTANRPSGSSASGNSAQPKAAPGSQRAGGPPGGPMAKSLTAEQVGLIRAWIDQGAK